MASILDILGYRNVSAAVQKVVTGIPDQLPKEFSTIKEDVLGDETSYVTFYGQRQTARRGEYGAQSRSRQLRPVGLQSLKLLHFPEHIKIRMELMLRLRNPNDLLAQQLAQQELARHGADMRTLFDNTRVATTTFMLAQGLVYFDQAGNILPNSTGAFFTVNYNIPSGQQNQLGGIIDKSWADPTANIIQHLTSINIQNRRNTGRQTKNAFYGKNVAAYVFNNATMQKYWQFNAKMYEAFAANPGAIPQGFAGLNWYPMGETFFNDQADATQPIWGDNVCTFTPEIDRNVYTLFEGSIAAPKYGAPQVTGDLLGAVNGYELVYGMGGYTVPEVDPVGLKHVMFDTFYPTWKNPGDMFIATVAF